MMYSSNRRKLLRSASALIALSALESLGFRGFASAADVPAAIVRPKRAVLLGFGRGVSYETWFPDVENRSVLNAVVTRAKDLQHGLSKTDTNKLDEYSPYRYQPGKAILLQL
jgi:hypothetical protein